MPDPPGPEQKQNGPFSLRADQRARPFSKAAVPALSEAALPLLKAVLSLFRGRSYPFSQSALSALTFFRILINILRNCRFANCLMKLSFP